MADDTAAESAASKPAKPAPKAAKPAEAAPPPPPPPPPPEPPPPEPPAPKPPAPEPRPAARAQTGQSSAPASAPASGTASAPASGTASATAANLGLEAARRAAETFTGFTRAAAERQTTMFKDLSKMFTDMRFPSMLPDSGMLMAAHRRNMDALSQANRLALEGAQAVARRHMEIMQQTMSDMTEHVRELAATGSPQAKAARQAELLKASYERAVGNIHELSDLIQRSNTEALALLEHRFSEAMDEIKHLLEQSETSPK